MRTILIVVLLLCTNTRVFTQSYISGTLKTRKQEAVSRASITLQGSYHGTTSSENGDFSFISPDTGFLSW